MTTWRRQTSLVLMVLLIAVPARGQQPAPSSAPARYVSAELGVTLEAAVARALDREPGMHAARTEIEVALSDRRQAALRPNPTVSLERREQTSGTDQQTRLGVEWPLDLFRRTGRVGAADRQVDIARLAAADRERLLAADVRLGYGLAAAAARDIVVADDLLSALDRQLALTRARVAEGAAPPLERDLLEVEVRRIEAERLLAVSRADVAMAELKPLLGMRPADELLLRDNIEALVATPHRTDGSAPLASADVRADVREAAARVRLAEAEVERARRDGRFDVGVFGMYMRMGVAGQSMTNVSGGAMVMVPLFNRNQGQVAAARAQVEAAEARHEAAALAAAADVAAARAREASARRAADLYGGRIQPLARRNLAVVQETFGLGRATIFDVLAEQRRFLDVERAYTAALREAWEARVALGRAEGETR